MRKHKELIISIIAILCILIMVTTMVYAASYSVLSTDDFSHGSEIGVSHVPLFEYIKASWAYTKSIYLNWQGTYSSMFIQALLSPINNYGFRQLRVVMAANALLFYITLIVFSLSSMSMIIKDRHYIKFIITAILVFCFCGFQTYPEVFFWFSGATSYSIPLSFLFLALTLFNKVSGDYQAGSIIGSVLLGIIAMGGSLTVSGTGCFVALLICVYICISQKKFPLTHMLILMSWIIAAGVNALSPGGLSRHSVIDQSGVHPISAFTDAIRMSCTRWDFFFKSTNFVFLLIIVLILGFMTGDVLRPTKNRFIISLIAMLTPIVTSYPVALGYSSDSLPNRCAFMIDISIVLSALNLVFVLGEIIYGQVESRKDWVITAIVIACAVFMLDGFGVSNVKFIQVSGKLSEGVYRGHYTACKEFIHSLEGHSKGEDVIIPYSEYPEEIDDIQNFYLSDDPDDYVNRAISQYYGFNSIIIDYE